MYYVPLYKKLCDKCAKRYDRIERHHRICDMYA
jgi:hypothetical protein